MHYQTQCPNCGRYVVVSYAVVVDPRSGQPIGPPARYSTSFIVLLILGVVLLPVGLLMMRAGAAGLLILGVFLIMGAVRSKSVSNRRLKEWQAKVDRFDNV